MEKVTKSQIKLIKSLQLKKNRDELSLFVAEGAKCVEELRKSFELVHLYREGENASRTEIEQMSGLKTPQGVVGVFRKRPMDEAGWMMDDLVIALDGIQDPGNLGTIIRTCDWFGVHDIVCSKETTDCYNPKVVQATMGALCRVRIHYVDLPEWLTKQECPIIGTLLEGENMYKVLSTFDSKRSTIIVMGNEGNGISQEVRKLITHPVRIPSYPNEKASDVIESLNVSIATAIVLAEFRR
ncbi:MAG: RNA methyltransferase [Bacteroidales bacterium]|nr:RNA methyltransferase [Bacteroidales bacterium]MDY6406272.1 RNA methyltransferase [Bacteroidales bacterium]